MKPSHQPDQAPHNVLPHTHHLTLTSLGLAKHMPGLFFLVEILHYHHLAECLVKDQQWYISKMDWL